MKSSIPKIIAVVFLFSFSKLSFSQSLRLLWEKSVRVQTMQFSSNSNRLITGGTRSNCTTCGELNVWRLKDSALLSTMTYQQMGMTNDLDVSSNNRTIISGNGSVFCGGEGGCYAMFPGQFEYSISGTLLKFLNPSGDIIYSIKYSPDNTIIASGTGYNNTGVIKIYDTSYNLLRVLDGHQYSTNGLAFTPNGQYLVSGGDEGLIKIWDYKTGALIRQMFHGDYLDGGARIHVDVSPDGNYIASAGDGYNMVVKVWRVADGQLVYTFPLTGGSYGSSVVKFSPDGQYIVSGARLYGSGSLGWYGKIFVWQMSDGKLVNQIIDKEGHPANGGITAIAFSNKKNYFAYSLFDKLKVFSIVGGPQAIAESKTEPIQKKTGIGTTIFPNPFTSKTTIQYNLPFKQFVTIIIMDNAGIQVAELVHEEKEAGTYQTTFNADNLSAGIYFCKITTKNGFEVKKIVLYK